MSTGSIARSSVAPQWRSSTSGQGWFLAVGSVKARLKLVFFDGASRAEVVERFGPSRARRSIILDDLGKEQF